MRPRSRRTRAAVLRTVGEPTTVEDLVVAEPRAGEVRVRMLASGVCHSDLHVRDGEWPRPTPIVMGHEGAGVVEALGPGVDRPASRPAGRAVVARPVRDLPVVPCRTAVGLPGFAVVPPPDAGRRDGPRDRRRRADPVVLRHRHHGRGGGRPGGRCDRPARRRGSGGRRTHRLLRVDRGRRRGQDRCRARRRQRGRHRAGWRRPVVRDGRGPCRRGPHRGDRPGRGQAGRGSRRRRDGRDHGRLGPPGDDRRAARPDRRRAGLRLRGDRPDRDRRTRHRGTATRRDGRPGRA